MKYTIDRKESYTIIQLQEKQLNSVIAPELKTALILMGNEGVKNIILDMTEVEFVDSSGLSAILVGHRMTDSENGVLILANPQIQVTRLIDISRLDQILTVTESVQAGRDEVMRLEFERLTGGENVSDNES